MIMASVFFSTPAEAIPAVPAMEGLLETRDNVKISYKHYKAGSDTVIIIAPGFFNSKDNRWMKKAVDIVYPKYDAIIFDFRGHGKSSGRFAWSSKETMDIDAVIDYAKSRNYKHIGILAFSMGGAAAVNAVSRRDDVDSMVLISCPSKINMIDFHFWEPAMFADLKDNIDCKWQGKGARISNPFLRKDQPVDSIRNIHNASILFIQGKMDWVIKERHAKKLYDAADGAKNRRVKIVENGMHAERMIQQYPDKLSRLISNWFMETL